MRPSGRYNSLRSLGPGVNKAKNEGRGVRKESGSFPVRFLLEKRAGMHYNMGLSIEKDRLVRRNMMNLPEYITADEVRRVCKELGIRDWTGLAEPVATAEEAAVILRVVNTSGMAIDVGEFRAGLDVELEHGTRFQDANVTNNHPVVTGRIVLAHMKESLDYYKLLDVAEAEGDLCEAIARGNMEKAKKYFGKLARARAALSEAQSRRLAAT